MVVSVPRVSPMAAAICTGAAIVFATLWPALALPLVLLCGALAVLLIRRWPNGPAVGWATWLALGVFLARWHHEAPPAIANQAARVITAEVMQVERSADLEGAPHFRVQLIDAGQRLAVRTTTEVLPGDVVRFTCRLRAPRALHNPGNAGQVWANAARGIDAVCTAPTLDVVDTHWIWQRSIALWHRTWRGYLDRAASTAEPGRAVVAGVVLGDRWEFNESMNQRWRDAGVFHALSVSGLHLAVVALGVLALLRRIVSLLPWGRRCDPVRVVAAPALLLALGYTLLTGGQVATWRSLLAVTFVVAARAAHVRVDRARVWGLVALLMLALAPLDMFDPSFQLTFVATYALIRLPSMAANDLEAVPRWRRIGRWLSASVRTSVWVALLTAPLTAFHFQQVAVAGVLANVVVLPLVEFIVLPIALVALVLAPLSTTLSDALLAMVVRVGGLADTITSHIAAHAPVAHVGLSSGVALVCAVGGLAWLLPRRQRGWRDAGVLLLVLAAWSLGVERRDPTTLRVTFLDVGQGDAAIIETPHNQVWLIDTGGFPNRTGPGKFATGDAVVRTLRARGIEQVDDVWISHPHPDHYLGLLRIVQELPVRRLWLPVGFDDAASEFGRVVASVAATGTEIRRPPLGLVAAEPNLRLSLLAPSYDRGDLHSLVAASDPVRTVNDNSAVLLLEFATRQVLFLGDVEREGELNLVPVLPPVDVVKVAHHGSRTSSSMELVQVAAPQLAVISCGFENTFGFPHPGVMERWQQTGAQVLRIDEIGAVTVEVTPAGELTWHSEVSTASGW